MVITVTSEREMSAKSNITFHFSHTIINRDEKRLKRSRCIQWKRFNRFSSLIINEENNFVGYFQNGLKPFSFCVKISTETVLGRFENNLHNYNFILKKSPIVSDV
jgi:hypothetical protein